MLQHGRTLFYQNDYAHVPPASTTKIMTAIIVLENGKLTDRITASYNAVMSVPSGGSSTAIQVGEILTTEQLLKCMLIPSRK